MTRGQIACGRPGISGKALAKDGVPHKKENILGISDKLAGCQTREGLTILEVMDRLETCNVITGEVLLV